MSEQRLLSVLSRPSSAADRRQVQLHGVVQPVERVVHGGQLGQQLAIVVLQRLQERPQHGFDNVDHAQHLARGIGQCQAWRADHRRLDVLGPARIVGRRRPQAAAACTAGPAGRADR